MFNAKIFEISEVITTRPDTGIFVSPPISLEDRRYLKSCLINGLPVNFSLQGKTFSLKITNLEVHGGDFHRDELLPIGICYNKKDFTP